MESISLFDTEADYYFDGHLFSLSEEDDDAQLRKGKNCDRRKQISSSFAFCILPYMGNNVELSLFLLYCCVSNESAAEAYSVIVQPIQLQTIRTFLCELFYNIHSYQCMLFLFFQLFHP